jgi:hypothetical protein
MLKIIPTGEESNMTSFANRLAASYVRRLEWLRTETEPLHARLREMAENPDPHARYEDWDQVVDELARVDGLLGHALSNGPVRQSSVNCRSAK